MLYISKNDKKAQTPRIFVPVLVLILLAAALLLPARAETAAPTEQDVLDTIRDNMPSLIYTPDTDSYEGVQQSLGIRRVLQLLIEGLGGSLLPTVKLLAMLCGMMMLGGVFGLCTEGMSSSGLKPMVDTVISGAVALGGYAALYGIVMRAVATLRDMASFSGAVFPMATALLYAGGSTTTAVAEQTYVTMILSLFELMATELLVPLIQACFAFVLVGSIDPGGGIGGISGTVRSIYLVLLGIMCAVATATLSAQTHMTCSADTALLRGARFAVGQMIPTVGASVGATLGTLSSSLGVLRDLLGGGAVAVLVFSLVPAVAELYLTGVALSLAGTLGGMLGFDRGKRICEDMRGIIHMMLATVSMVSVLFIVMFGMFMKTAFAF